MPRVLTRCPSTAVVVPTRLFMDASTFDAVGLAGHSLDCPSCGQAHVWDQDKAWVDGQAEPVAGAPSRRPPPLFPTLMRADRSIDIESLAKLIG